MTSDIKFSLYSEPNVEQVPRSGEPSNNRNTPNTSHIDCRSSSPSMPPSAGGISEMTTTRLSGWPLASAWRALRRNEGNRKCPALHIFLAQPLRLAVLIAQLL